MSTVNHMSHSRTGTATGGYRYSIAPINSNYQVHYALASPWARDLEYVRGIIRSYVEQKRLRGKTSQEVGTKLNLLEKELPSFLPSFCDVREQYSLPPSPWVRRPRLDFSSPSSGSGPSRRVSSATTSRYNVANPSLAHFEGFGGGGGGMSPLTRTTTAPGRQQSADRRNNGNRLSGAGGAAAGAAVDDSALPAEFRVRRQNTEDRDEPPPPPYARQDPEPDSTRLLAERLAAEHGDSIPLNPPEADSNTPNNEQSQDDRSPARPTTRPTPPRPDHASRPSSHSTPNQNQNQNRNSTPPMPGSYAAPLSPPPRAASSTSAHAQGGSPNDSDRRPELARSDSEQLRMAYEDSQLEEAKRESMAAEREREEMERAIQMSLEAEEAETMERVRRESGTGNASASGSGAGGYGQGPVGFIQPQHAENTSRHAQGPGSNRSAGANGPSGSSFDSFGDVGQLEGQMQQTNLLDGDDQDQFLAIPPMHTGQGRAGQHAGLNGASPPAISPRLGSKNPFLSPHDSAKPLPRPPSQSQQRPPSHSSASSSRLVYQVPYTNSNHASGTTIGHSGSQSVPQSSSDLPPASPGYQAVSNQARASSAQQGTEAEEGRAVVIVDDGAHVQGFDKAQEIVQGLITQAKLDVYFVNSKRVGKDIEAVEDVQDLFGGLAPRGSASVGARLDYLLHEHNIVIITDGTCARPIAKRAKQLRINPSLTSEQLLSGEPADDLEKVLETRVGRVHFVQVGDDEEGRKGLQVLASKGMGMDVYTALSEEFVQSALYS